MYKNLISSIMLLTLTAIWGAKDTQAALINIASYDITNSLENGIGGYEFQYSGDITPAGFSTDNFLPLADFSNGSGTLNNNIIETEEFEVHGFNWLEDTMPIITLFFDGLYTIDSLLFKGGDIAFGNFVGDLNGVTVSFSGNSENFQSIDTGFQVLGGSLPRFADDLIELTQSSLAGVLTDRIVLSGFTSSSFENTFTLAEIEVYGTTNDSTISVSEPPIALLLTFALGFILFARRTNRLNL